MAEVTNSGSPEAARQQLSMNGDQLEALMSRLVAAVRQTAAPLSPGQQAVELKFRLLRNGLGRFQSPSQGYDRALLRMHQIHREGGSRLLIDDPIPPDAGSMILVVKGQRRRYDIPTFVHEGKCVHPVDGESVVIELVEFQDRFETPIAAGVPIQVWEQWTDQRSGVGGAETVAPTDENTKTRAVHKSGS